MVLLLSISMYLSQIFFYVYVSINYTIILLVPLVPLLKYLFFFTSNIKDKTVTVGAQPKSRCITPCH